MRSLLLLQDHVTTSVHIQNKFQNRMVRRTMWYDIFTLWSSQKQIKSVLLWIFRMVTSVTIAIGPCVRKLYFDRCSRFAINMHFELYKYHWDWLRKLRSTLIHNQYCFVLFNLFDLTRNLFSKKSSSKMKLIVMLVCLATVAWAGHEKTIETNGQTCVCRRRTCEDNLSCEASNCNCVLVRSS